MKTRITISHPHVKPVHVKHTAALMTFGGGVAEIFTSLPHLGSILFVIAGCLAIYEQNLIHVIEVHLMEHEHVD